MKNSFRYLILVLPFILSSCGINQIYTSGSYGGLKSYTEQPIYNGKNVTATYVSGALRTGVFPQRTNDDKVDDKVVSGNFSIHQSTSLKNFNYYYGLGGVFGNYKFNSDLKNVDVNLDNHFNKGDNLNFYNLNLKVGGSYKKSWSKSEFNFIGIEFMYINEFGPYIDKLNSIKGIDPDVLIVDEKSFFAFNLNTEFTISLNKDHNVGMAFYVGNVLLNSKQRAKIRRLESSVDSETSMSGVIVKYQYKKTTFSIITESSAQKIESTLFGLTYRIK